MTDLKALLEAEAKATPPPAIDTTATIIRIAHHRRRRTAMVAGAAAAVVAATATFSFGNTSGEIPTVAPSTTPDRPLPTMAPSIPRESLGSCGKPVPVRNQPASDLRMTLKSAGMLDSQPPRITLEVKVTNHSARTLSGSTASGPLTMAATKGKAFAFGGQWSSLKTFELAPGASAIYTGVIVVGDCINAKDFDGRTFEAHAEQTFVVNGKSYTVYGGPWNVK